MRYRISGRTGEVDVPSSVRGVGRGTRGTPEVVDVGGTKGRTFSVRTGGLDGGQGCVLVRERWSGDKSDTGEGPVGKGPPTKVVVEDETCTVDVLCRSRDGSRYGSRLRRRGEY